MRCAAAGHPGKLRAVARALQTPSPTAEEAKSYGLTLEEAEDASACEVWPDNLHAVNVFIAMSTQWRVGGMSGTPIGLDYGPMRGVMRTMKVPPAEWSIVFDGVRVLEDATLMIMRRTAERARARR